MMTGKPALYVCNVDEAGLREDNHHVRAVRKKAAEEGASVVVLCAKVEAEISELDDPADRKDICRPMRLHDDEQYRWPRQHGAHQ